MATTNTKEKETSPKKVFVVAVNGDILHLYTNVWFTKDPKKVEVDDFVQAQLDAGKLAISDET